MRHRKHHRMKNVSTEPDLPIVPMLDLSFQLMFFFVSTFRPQPMEGQLPLLLPADNSDGKEIPDIVDKPFENEVILIQVASTETGNIADISFASKGGTINSLGADTSVLFKFLKDRAAENVAADGKQKASVNFQFGDRLNYQYVIKMLDEAKRAGFSQITPSLLKLGGSPTNQNN